MKLHREVWLIGFTLVLVFAIRCWTLYGILDIDRMEGEGYYVIFQKENPSLKLFFNDPYYSDPRGAESIYQSHMDAHRDWLPGTSEFRDFMDYCWARY